MINATKRYVNNILLIITYIFRVILPRKKILEFNFDNIGKISKDNGFYHEIPKVIWMYWEDINIPSYIDKIISKMESLNPDHKINLLNPSNVDNFHPEFTKISAPMPIANKTDLLRLYLLKEYGGIWVDCTTVVFSSFSWVHQLKRYDLIAFYRKKSTLDYSHPVIESWFICSPPNNPFIQEWYSVLEPLSKLGSKKYYDVLSARDDYKLIRQNINSPEYLLVYLACQIAMRNIAIKDHSYYLECCEESAFIYQEAARWTTRENFFHLMFFNKSKSNPKLVKLTGLDRRFIPLALKLGLIRKSSVLGFLK